MTAIKVLPIVLDSSRPGFTTVGSGFSDGSGYWLVLIPLADSQEDWFGADHYVELNDQAGGQYGGVKAMDIGKDSLTLTLSGKADVFGGPLRLMFSEPMAAEAVDMLSRIGSKR